MFSPTTSMPLRGCNVAGLNLIRLLITYELYFYYMLPATAAIYHHKCSRQSRMAYHNFLYIAGGVENLPEKKQIENKIS